MKKRIILNVCLIPWGEKFKKPSYILTFEFFLDIPDKEYLEFVVANKTKEEVKNSMSDVKKGLFYYQN